MNKKELLEGIINMPVKITFADDDSEVEGYLSYDLGGCICDYEILPFDYKSGKRYSFNVSDVKHIIILTNNYKLW